MISRTLIEAARFQKREDRLTEILAVVLSTFEPAAIELLRRAGLEATTVEVTTQAATRLGKRVDMQIVGLDSEGRRCARLWSEHKTGADYMEDQLQGYARELDGLGGPSRLITIAERGTPPWVDPRWSWLTWDELATCLERVGHEYTDERRWRRSAALPGADAGIRMLNELLLYLEEEHEVVLEPLSPLDIVAFGGANAAGERLVAMLERAAEESHLKPSRSPDWRKDDWGLIWQMFEAGGWSEALGGYPELLVSESDFWLEDLLGAPAFGAGLTIQSRVRDRLLEADDGGWARKAEELGFCIFEAEGVTRVYRTRYLTDLVSAGASIDEQARDLGVWSTEAIDQINVLVPGIP